MKRIWLYPFALLFSLPSPCQRLFQIQEVGIQSYHGDTKFDNTRKFAIGALSRSQHEDYMTPKTVWAVDFLPTASFFLHKRINILLGFGAEAHKIRNDFRPEIAELTGASEKYKKYRTNLLYKTAIGGQFFLIGDRYRMVNLRLNTLFTLEGFIKNNTRNYIALGPFGFPTRVDDYAGNPLRLGIDVIPVINMNISQDYAFQIGAGYSFGLNESNKRIARFSDAVNNNYSLTIFSRKESTFIFYGSVFYNFNKKPRRSLKTFNWREWKEKINIGA